MTKLGGSSSRNLIKNILQKELKKTILKLKVFWLHHLGPKTKVFIILKP